MVAFSKPIIGVPPPTAVSTLTRSSHSRHRASRIPNLKPPTPKITSQISTACSAVFVVCSRAQWARYVRAEWISWARKVKREPATAPAKAEGPAADATRIVGIDCEWTPTSPLTVLQIGDADATFVFQVAVCGSRPSRRKHVHALWLPSEVRSFLESSTTAKCGVNVTEDVRLIRRELNIKVAGAFDIDRAAQTDFGMGSPDKYCGLKALCKMYLGATLNKEQQTSNWATHRLSFEQAAYAANDAITSALIGQHLHDHGGDVQRWVRAAEKRLNAPTRRERNAAKQMEPPVPKTVKPPALNNEVLRVFYLGREIESVSRGYAIHKLKGCSITTLENADGTTEEIVVLHEPPKRRNKTCSRFRDGKCTAGDSCAFIHKNGIAAQEELYEEWGRMFAARSSYRTCCASRQPRTTN